MFRYFVYSLLFSVYLYSSFVSASPLVLNNSPISTLADWVSAETGKIITFSDSSNVPVSISIPDSGAVDPWLLFENTASSAGLFINELDSIFVVSSTPPLSVVEPVDYPLNTYTYSVYPVNLSDISTAFNSLLSSWNNQESLRLGYSIPPFSIETSGNQSLLLLTIPSKLKPDADMLVNALNKPPRQVLVEAIIFETTDLDFEAVGVDFRHLSLDGLSLDYGANTGPLAVVTKGFGLSYSRDGEVKSVIRALDTNDKTTILSTPELRIMDRESGRVQVGNEVPFITSTSTSDTGQVTNTVIRQTVGLNFSVKPVIQSDNTIRITFSTSVGSLTGDSTAADVITTNRSVNTVITAYDGELVYLGGLITEELKGSLVTVPLLSDLPILGGLFASNERKENKTKLSVFIKTTII